MLIVVKYMCAYRALYLQEDAPIPAYEHLQIARLIKEIDTQPSDHEALSSWSRAEQHLQLLSRDAGEEEVILYSVTRTSFVYAVIAPESDVSPPDHDDLLKWNATPYTTRAAYTWNKGASDMRLEPWDDSHGTRTLSRSQNLVFARQMEGTDYPTNYELLQEFVHATGIHWREEERAYCVIDENGDLESLVSFTDEHEAGGLKLITCKRKPLEQYLSATGNVLVRFFDFTMVLDGFSSWRDGNRKRKTESDTFFYEQCLHPDGHGFTRGTQLLPVATPKDELFRDIVDPPYMRADRQYASFIVEDWRNREIAEVSTAPGETANYFNAEGNSLPFELSAAFFRPEVLSKYKADTEKYTVDEVRRSISCRGAWGLRSFDVNEAGQIHAYLCYLRHLPFQEQEYWKSFNEKPKGTISKRAIENDFQGDWSSCETPLETVLRTVRRWNNDRPDWWKAPDETLLRRVNTPVSSSRVEWARACLDLSVAVIEGFNEKVIRSILRRENIPFDKLERSLSLIEKLMAHVGVEDEEPGRLEFLRLVYRIRTMVISHRGGSDGDQIARDALSRYGTYRAHFEHVCVQLADELDMIEEILSLTHDKQ